MEIFVAALIVIIMINACVLWLLHEKVDTLIERETAMIDMNRTLEERRKNVVEHDFLKDCG